MATRTNNLKILKNPRITEKASMVSEANIYTFDVAMSANKTEIEKAVFALYKVKPTKVNIVPVPPKNRMTRGKEGRSARGKKAYVYLKKGDKIEFI